ncbi:flagellar FliJ family protein [Desertibaculum subflavum]|uniref:flagellar FliJ family protein n=1 Tax=Desertibaculum subflavum TaxID=2268458 RepID=UPI000E673B80
MKSIATLIRLKRWALDEKRRALADLERLRTEMVERAAALEGEIAAEQGAAPAEVVQFAYAAYVRRAMGQREALAQSIGGIDSQIAEAQLEIGEVFSELKRYERVQEMAQQKAQSELKRRETAVMDEIAGRRHAVRPPAQSQKLQPAKIQAKTA